MRRREFIAGVLAASAIGRAEAQQNAKVFRLAVVAPSTPVSDMSEHGDNSPFRAFFQKLRALGYVEGQNLSVERYSAEGRTGYFAELAREVVRSNPDLIFSAGSRLTLDFKAATDSIPMVAVVGDAVAHGIVPSVARPGGNITGISEYEGIEIWGKSLGFLKEALPRLFRVGFLVTATRLDQRGEAMLRETAAKLGVSLVIPALKGSFDEAVYREAFRAMAEEAVEAIFVADDAVNLWNQRLIIELAQAHQLPAIYFYREYVQNGGLMAYYADTPDLYRHAANQVDQILRGTKPGDIPFSQARKFNLAINLKAAKAFGFELPLSFLAQVDEVVE